VPCFLHLQGEVNGAGKGRKIKAEYKKWHSPIANRKWQIIVILAVGE
jgi:hypothetical protein